MSILSFVIAAAVAALPTPPVNQQLELCIQRAELTEVKKIPPPVTVDRLIQFLVRSGYSASQVAEILETCHSFEVGRNYQTFITGPKT